MAGPATQHHLAALPGHAAILAIETARPITESGLLRGLTSRREALAALEHNRARRELAQVHIHRARDPATDSATRRDDIEAATSTLREALGRAPADHFAWYHLAVAEALAADAATAARALTAAYSFGPYHPPIRAARVSLGLALWTRLEPRSREQVLGELVEVRAGGRR